VSIEIPNAPKDSVPPDGAPPEVAAALSSGEAAEAAGDVAAARAAYRRAAALAPDDARAHYRLALLDLDEGDLEAAAAGLIEVLRIAPDHRPALARLARVHRERGDLGAAEECLAAATAGASGPIPPSVDRERRAIEDARRGAAPLWLGALLEERREEAALALLEAFSGREGIYAQMWVDRRGRAGYAPVREQLDTGVLARHIAGEITVGAYAVIGRDLARWAAIDLDAGPRGPGVQGPPENALSPEAALARTVPVARRIAQAAERAGLPVPLLEWSGAKGVHVWLLFAEEVPASLARRLAEALVEAAGPLDPAVRAEVFPKQDEVAGEGCGSLVKIPLGIHRKTGRRSAFIDERGRVLADPLGALRATVRLRRADAEAAIGRLRAAAPRPPAPPATDHRAWVRRLLEEESPFDRTPPSGGSRRGGGRAAPSPSPSIDPGQSEARGRALLDEVVSGCAVLRALVEKARRERDLRHEERVVLLYALGAAGPEGAAAVHAAIAPCSDYDPEYTQAQIDRMKPNAISCARIRDRLPRLAREVGCDCPLRPPPGGYATPLLHALPSFDGRRRRRPVVAARAPRQAPDLARDVVRYLDLRRKLAAIEEEVRGAERALMGALEAAAAEAVPFPGGRIERAGDGVRIVVGTGSASSIAAAAERRADPEAATAMPEKAPDDATAMPETAPDGVTAMPEKAPDDATAMPETAPDGVASPPAETAPDGVASSPAEAA
jgi:hypothetical protein